MTTKTLSAHTLSAGAFAASRLEILRAALVVFTLGAGLVYLAGFSFPSAAHNAAHDTRHSLGFPCH
jgi:cobalt transporter subunit CbtB